MTPTTETLKAIALLRESFPMGSEQWWDCVRWHQQAMEMEREQRAAADAHPAAGSAASNDTDEEMDYMNATQQKTLCRSCKGSSYTDEANDIDCETCGGTGYLLIQIECVCDAPTDEDCRIHNVNNQTKLKETL